MSFPLYCITNRHLYALPFLEQLDRILALRPAEVILREKDLSLEEYLALGRQVLENAAGQGCPAGSTRSWRRRWNSGRMGSSCPCRCSGSCLPGGGKVSRGGWGPPATVWTKCRKRPGWGRIAAPSAMCIPPNASRGCRPGAWKPSGRCAPKVPFPSMLWEG